MLRFGVRVALVLAAMAAYAQQDGWQAIIEDEFDREMIGGSWRVLRGDWRIENGRLRVTRAWPSDSNVLCTIPMPRGDARAVVRFRLEEECSLQIALRAGEHFWGGGGLPDAVSVQLRSPAGPTEVKLVKDEIEVAPNTDYTIELAVIGRTALVSVDGKQMMNLPVPAARSEVNRGFYMNCMPNGWIESVKLYARAPTDFALPPAANSAEENRAATIHAGKFIDPANPAPGMQKAIDSLPANGGVVILPAGEFLMRRHLALRSGVTLRGQGFDKTILRHAPIRETKVLKQEQGEAACKVTVEDASPFRVGDALCFGGQWSHVGGSDPRQPGRDHVVTAIEGNVLTVSGRVPEKSGSVKNFFPLVFCVVAEFAEVKDLTLRGPESGPGGGGFNTCPVSFGCIYGARIHRVNVEGFPADGISVQFAGDTLVTDNTVTGTAQGFHPGTRTQRFLWARNRSVGNTSGLYFCFSNENGIYYRNATDDFTGYPGVGDVFNLLNANDAGKGVGIGSGGFAGLFFNNRMSLLLTDKVPPEPGWPLYFSAPHYYVFAENRLGELRLGEGTQAVVMAGNAPLEKPGPLAPAGDLKGNLFSAEGLGLAAKFRLPVGPERTAPVAPPALPESVLDAALHYDPNLPDVGFQAALDALAVKRGTVLLPGGRYTLAAPLRVPSGVALAGQGIGTVLCSAATYRGPLVLVEDTRQTTVRDLTIRSGYDPAVRREPAVSVRRSEGVRLEGLDIRGWEGDGVRAEDSSVVVRDCRSFSCGGDAYRFAGGGAEISTSLAKSCARGFVIERTTATTVVEGCIASGHRGPGIALLGARAPLVHSNNCAFNGGDGIVVVGVSGGVLAANVCRANNQSLAGAAGIRLAAPSEGCTAAYNHCSDDQIHATQAHGLMEEEGARGNLIRFNLACPFYMNHQPPGRAPVLAKGKGSTVADNLTLNACPSGSSIESRELGFSRTPHWHNMRKARLVQQKAELERRLAALVEEEGRRKAQMAAAEKSLAELAQKAAPDAQQEALKARLAQLSKAVESAARPLVLCRLEANGVELELRVIAQETAVGRSKYAVMRLRDEGGAPGTTEQAQAAVKAEEDRLKALNGELAALQARIAQAQK